MFALRKRSTLHSGKQNADYQSFSSVDCLFKAGVALHNLYSDFSPDSRPGWESGLVGSSLQIYGSAGVDSWREGRVVCEGYRLRFLPPDRVSDRSEFIKHVCFCPDSECNLV